MTSEPEPTMVPSGERASEPAMPSMARPKLSPLRSALPFLVAGFLLWLLARKLDFDAFFETLAKVDPFALLGFAMLWQTVLLAADAFGNFVAYRRTMPQASYIDFYLFRGASYLPGMINHHLGQAYMTYLQARLLKIPLARMAGTTLVSYATWMGCLVGCMTIAVPFTDLPLGFVPVVLLCGGLYLLVVSRPPRFLRGVTLLKPLFEAGLGGHLRALVGRLPHLAVLVLGTWISFRLFGIRIPLGTALVYLPILLVVVTLPITPQGFGAREAASATFFAAYAPGATEPERIGSLAAASTGWAVSITLAAILLGVVCSRFVDRKLARLQPEPATEVIG